MRNRRCEGVTDGKVDPRVGREAKQRDFIGRIVELANEGWNGKFNAVSPPSVVIEPERSNTMDMISLPRVATAVSLTGTLPIAGGTA